MEASTRNIAFFIKGDRVIFNKKDYYPFSEFDPGIGTVVNVTKTRVVVRWDKYPKPTRNYAPNRLIWTSEK